MIIGPYQALADAMLDLADSKCGLCHTRDHFTKDHPKPVKPSVCTYCWQGRCKENGDCGNVTCPCLCLIRGAAS